VNYERSMIDAAIRSSISSRLEFSPGAGSARGNIVRVRDSRAIRINNAEIIA